MKNKLDLKIQTIKLHDIKPTTYNPRKNLKPGDAEYETLKGSLKNFGYVEPLVWNKRTGNLVGGHQRFKILKAQKLKEVEVSVVDLSPQDEKKLNLALNRIRGEWDEEKLAVVLGELSELTDFNVESLGFNLPEISEILDNHGEKFKDDDFDTQADVEANVQPITKPGELIELGPHRILCADASSLKNLQQLMQGEKANLLDCDFPYNVNYMGGKKPTTNGRPKKSRRWNQIYADNLPQAEYERFMKKVLTNVKTVLMPGAAIYIWQGHRQFPPMYHILLELGFHVSCVISWLKESAAISYADYSFQTEQCLYGWLEGAPHYFAGSPGQSNVWDVKRDPTKTYQHPTQKPVELAHRAIKNSSKRGGEIVLDTFLGSGSVLIACEALKRRCFGTEIDPRYVDAIVRRYIAFIGEKKVSKSLKRYLKKEVTL